eukprot:GHVU01069148.1.p1 GENE.GHVU01069148.1~~GHVU01069148.1.p1  ORF type:complete len:2547 (-),score=193.55 GHVU01069148.1:246-7886(-)
MVFPTARLLLSFLFLLVVLWQSHINMDDDFYDDEFFSESETAEIQLSRRLEETLSTDQEKKIAEIMMADVKQGYSQSSHFLYHDRELMVSAADAALYFKTELPKDRVPIDNCKVEDWALNTIFERTNVLGNVKATYEEQGMMDVTKGAFRMGLEEGLRSLKTKVVGELKIAKKNLAPELRVGDWDYVYREDFNKLMKIKADDVCGPLSIDLDRMMNLKRLIGELDRAPMKYQTTIPFGGKIGADFDSFMHIRKHRDYLAIYVRRLQKEKELPVLICSRNHLLNYLERFDTRIMIRACLSIHDKIGSGIYPTLAEYDRFSSPFNFLQNLCGNTAFHTIKCTESKIIGMMNRIYANVTMRGRLERHTDIDIHEAISKLESNGSVEFLVDLEVPSQLFQYHQMLEKESEVRNKTYVNALAVGGAEAREFPISEVKVKLADSLITLMNDVCQNMSKTQLSELFGTQKGAYGYASPDAKASFLKARALMTTPHVYTEMGNIARAEAKGCLTEKFVKAYITKHRRAPPVYSPEKIPNPRLRNFFVNHRTVLNSLSIMKIPPEDWSHVRLAGPLTFRVHEELMPYIDDKAIARPLKELSSIYSRNSTGIKIPDSQCKQTRRIVRETIKMAGVIDLLGEMIKFGEKRFDRTRQLYYLKPKERQINAYEERVFGFTTPLYRLILGALENQLACQVFPYFKSIALGDSEKEQHDRLENHRVQIGRSWAVTLCLDFKKWCQNKDHVNTGGTAELCDSLFDIHGGEGMPVRPYEAQHEFANGCVFVPQKTNMPPMSLRSETKVTENEFLNKLYGAVDKEAKLRDAAERDYKSETLKDFYNMFYSQHRNVEGQFQKFWTIDTLADFLAVMSKLGYHGEISVQGDNLILFLYIPIPDSIPKGEEDSPSSRKLRDEGLANFEVALMERARVMNKPLKASETWSSSDLAIFSKKFIWDRVILSQGLKAATKIGSESNDLIVSANTRIGGVFSAAAGASHSSHDGTAYYLVAWARSAIEVCSELVESSVDPRKPSKVKMIQEMPKVRRKDMVPWLIYFSLAMTSAFSFPAAICAYTMMSVKGSPDPAADAMACIRLSAYGEHPIAKAIMMYLSSAGIKRERKADASFLIDSPLSIPLLPVKDVSQIATNLTRDLVSKSPDNSPLIQCVMSDQVKDHGRSLKKALIQMTPHFCPKVASFLYQSSLAYGADMLAKSCYSRSTLRSYGGVPKRVSEEAVTMQEETVRARMHFINDVYSYREGKCEVQDFEYGFNICRNLRKDCVRDPNVVVDGVTCPCPAEQMIIVRRSLSDKIPPEAHGLVTVNFSSLKGKRVRVIEARGPGVTIHGSRTDDKVSRGVLLPDRYKPTQSQCVRLASGIKMLTSEGSGMDNVADVILRSQSDIGIKEGREYTGCQTEGCTWHRLPNKMINSFASLVPRGGLTSFMQKSSDNLCSLTATSAQPMILFQGWFLHTYARLTSILSAYRYEEDGIVVGGEKVNTLSFLIVPIEGSWFEAYTGLYDLPSDAWKSITPVKPHEKLIANLRESAIQMGRMPNLPFKAESTNTTALEVAAARVVYRDNVRSSYQLVSSIPTGGLKPAAPVIKLGNMKGLNLRKILDSLAFEILVDDIHLILNSLVTKDPTDDREVVQAKTEAAVARIERQATGIAMAEVLTSPACRDQLDGIIDEQGPRYDVYESKSALSDTIREYMSKIAGKYMTGDKELPDLSIFEDEIATMKNDEAISRALKYMVLIAFVSGGPCCGSVPSRLSTVLREAQENVLERSRAGRFVSETEVRIALNSSSRHLQMKGGCGQYDVIMGMIRNGFPRRIKHVFAHPRVLLSKHIDEGHLAEEDEDITPGPHKHGLNREQVGGWDIDLSRMTPGLSTDKRFIAKNCSPDMYRPRKVTIEPTLGTNKEADPQLTHLFKESYFLSSAPYKLADILMRAGLVGTKKALCLADGAGGFSSFLARLKTTTSVMWQSLSRPLDHATISGQAMASVPEEIVVLPFVPKIKIRGLDEVKTGSGDLMDLQVVEQTIRVAQKYLGKADLITCDAKLLTQYMEGRDVVAEYYNLFFNVGLISRRVLTEEGTLIIKGFLAVPAVVQAYLNALSVFFRSVLCMTSIYSSNANTEVYFLCTQQRTGELSSSTRLMSYYSDKQMKGVLAALRPDLRRGNIPHPLISQDRALEVSSLMCEVYPSKVAYVAGHLVNSSVADLVHRGVYPMSDNCRMSDKDVCDLWIAFIDIAIESESMNAIDAKREAVSASCVVTPVTNIESSKTITMTQMRNVTGRAECKVAALMLLKRLILMSTNEVRIDGILKEIRALVNKVFTFRSRDMSFGVHLDKKYFSSHWMRPVMTIIGTCFISPWSIIKSDPAFTMLQAGGRFSDFDDICHSKSVSSFIAQKAFQSWFLTHGSERQKPCIVTELFAGRGSITASFASLSSKQPMIINAFTDRGTDFDRYVLKATGNARGSINVHYRKSIKPDFEQALLTKGIISLDIPWAIELDPYGDGEAFLSMCERVIMKKNVLTFTASGWSGFPRQIWEDLGAVMTRDSLEGRDIYIIRPLE